MKKALYYVVILFLFSCNQAEDDFKEVTTGTLVLNASQAPMKLVEVANERLSATKEEYVIHITIVDSNFDEYATASNIGENYSLEMDPGKYTLYMEAQAASGKYSGLQESIGEAAFEIIAGEETDLSVVMERTYVEVQPIIKGMDNTARVWVGPKGFVPSVDYAAEYSQTEDGPSVSLHYFNTSSVDIVVEFEGETKRFNLSVNKGTKYIVTINNSVDDEDDDNDGEVTTGSLNVKYSIKEQVVEKVTFNF